MTKRCIHVDVSLKQHMVLVSFMLAYVTSVVQQLLICNFLILRPISTTFTLYIMQFDALNL